VRRFGAEKGTILLSHHPLFSWKGVGSVEGKRVALNPKLYADFAPVLGDVALWFWGHEHNLAVFAPYAGLRRGRGIGSGAIPVFVEQAPYAPVEGLVVPEGEAAPPAPLPGTEMRHDGVVYDHAFALLRLEGTKATVSYHASDTTGAAPGSAPPLRTPLFVETVERGRPAG
jgi:hypothetical protein